MLGKNHIDTLIRISKDFKSYPEEDDWLDNLNDSQAFLACIGAGPWKIKRRREIQQKAIYFLGKSDLRSLYYRKPINIFPLSWQNNMVTALAEHLYKSGINMTTYCSRLKTSPNALDLLHIHCNTSKSKVLSLFIRDRIKGTCFPIDRHVKTFLLDNNLPINENDIISLCTQANVDPRILSKQIASLFVQNPTF